MKSGKGRESGIGIIILAAGSASRMGVAKQLLPFNGSSMLEHCMEAATGSGAFPIVVVLGAHSDEIGARLENWDAHVTLNDHWQEGMASSIHAGLHQLLKIDPSVEAVILMVCDQPHISASVLKELIAVHRVKGARIVASSYADVLGTPALFHSSMFQELFGLQGDVGARSLMQRYTAEVEAIPFPEGVKDIDTQADYLDLLHQTGGTEENKRH